MYLLPQNQPLYQQTPADANKPTGLIPQIISAAYALMSKITILLTIISRGSVRMSILSKRAGSLEMARITKPLMLREALVIANTIMVRAIGVM